MSKVALFCEKMHKVLKNKAQRCSTPLTLFAAKVQTFANSYIYTRICLSFNPFLHSAGPPPRLKAKFGRIVSDDESDYEDDGFIDDTPLEDEGADVSSYIKEIFGYDKSK